MRSVWKGSVVFGMVTIPVRLYTATQEHDVKFHQVHGTDQGRIRYKRVCAECGQEVAYEEIDRAVEQPDGTLVTVTKDELDALTAPAGHEIDVVQFVPAEQVDPVLFARSYYLEPDAKAVKPYALLREALRDTDRIAIGRIALRQRESLAALRVRDGVIIVQTMLWPDEIREPSFEVLSTEVTLRPQERQQAHALVESLTSDFDPHSYTDRYTEAVAELVAAKAVAPETTNATRPTAAEPAEPPDAPATELVDALRTSVERAKTQRAKAQRAKAKAAKATGSASSQDRGQDAVDINGADANGADENAGDQNAADNNARDKPAGKTTRRRSA